MKNFVAKTVEYREKNNFSRPDFMQLLIELKNSSKETTNPFTMEQLVSANVRESLLIDQWWN
ncbi:hypothetical protein NQ314_008559 [Rhamnusium bicolor]|uniref:Uncharacterized protein n=1 Tax=Rhamnusium bicolor TaxID=1586634 RepID=A0AAV8Y886_9CUCU|nr:hypothetical protein NQ314_008559 [Rhamnusium bicolor]